MDHAEHFMTFIDQYSWHYATSVKVDNFEEDLSIQPLQFSGGDSNKVLSFDYEISYPAKEDSLIQLLEFHQEDGESRGELNRVLCTIPPEK